MTINEAERQIRLALAEIEKLSPEDRARWGVWRRRSR
jgi:hypothetical protein